MCLDRPESGHHHGAGQSHGAQGVCVCVCVSGVSVVVWVRYALKKMGRIALRLRCECLARRMARGNGPQAPTNPPAHPPIHFSHPPHPYTDRLGRTRAHVQAHVTHPPLPQIGRPRSPDRPPRPARPTPRSTRTRSRSRTGSRLRTRRAEPSRPTTSPSSSSRSVGGP